MWACCWLTSLLCLFVNVLLTTHDHCSNTLVAEHKHYLTAASILAASFTVLWISASEGQLRDKDTNCGEQSLSDYFGCLFFQKELINMINQTTPPSTQFFNIYNLLQIEDKKCLEL